MVCYLLTFGCLSHTYLIRIGQNCNLYYYASSFICDCISEGSLFKSKHVKVCEIQNSKTYYFSKNATKIVYMKTLRYFSSLRNRLFSSPVQRGQL